jgi:hypothetical protein
MNFTYDFEPMENGMYQVRLCGMFVCYSFDKNERGVDEYLKREGYYSRKDYFQACLEDID